MTSELGRRLRAARRRLGYTVRDIERFTKNEVTDSYYSQLENSKCLNPHPHKLRALCIALDLDYIDMMIAVSYITVRDLRDRGLR